MLCVDCLCVQWHTFGVDVVGRRGNTDLNGKGFESAVKCPGFLSWL